MTPTVSFNYDFLTRENADVLPFLICRESRYVNTGATCFERKGFTAYSISFLIHFIKDLDCHRNILKYDNETSTKVLQDTMIHSCVIVEVIP